MNRNSAFVLLLLALYIPASAQQRALTVEDYTRAEKLLPASVNPLVKNGSIRATWISDDTFWYKIEGSGGDQYLRINAATGKRFAYSPTPEDTGRSDRPWWMRMRSTSVESPDGKKEAFIRDWNLWVRDKASKKETQLTTDGVENFGYATDNAGWKHSDRPILLWSPDSRKIATQQQDDRNLGDMYLVETTVSHPVLQSWKYPLPGDSIVSKIHRVIIEVDEPKVIRLKMPPDFHRGTVEDDITMQDLKWSPDGSRLAFISTSRFHKDAWVRVADASTGNVREVYHEYVATHYEMNCEWQVLWDTNEFIWYSERDDWGQLYLYDLTSGKLKNKITQTPAMVVQIEKLDEKDREIIYGAYGAEKGRDPYFLHYYRVGLNGKGLTLLTPENGNHSIQLSPTGAYLVDTYSQMDVPPVTKVYDRNGRHVIDVEEADISGLQQLGWKPPMPVTMKGRDGKTDIYGLLFRPTNFDASKKYPIINYAYPGPQSGSTGSRSFSPGRGGHQALAELGFVVVTIDGMGTPNRQKSFHDWYYGAMGRDNTLPDQVGGMKQLAERFSWIDIDRAGMWGHSGGGFITAGAMFRYPDFFKVGVSQSGNHDQRLYEDDWGERYQGELVRNTVSAETAEPGTHMDVAVSQRGRFDVSGDYETEANQTMAKNLKGKLLLAHGLLDDNVPPYNTLIVVEELIKHNKDFDLILYPSKRHGYGDQNDYMTRRRWDYFVRHLLGAEPPKEYKIGRED